MHGICRCEHLHCASASTSLCNYVAKTTMISLPLSVSLCTHTMVTGSERIVLNLELINVEQQLHCLKSLQCREEKRPQSWLVCTVLYHWTDWGRRRVNFLCLSAHWNKWMRKWTSAKCSWSVSLWCIVTVGCQRDHVNYALFQINTVVFFNFHSR